MPLSNIQPPATAGEDAITVLGAGGILLLKIADGITGDAALSHLDKMLYFNRALYAGKHYYITETASLSIYEQEKLHALLQNCGLTRLSPIGLTRFENFAEHDEAAKTLPASEAVLIADKPQNPPPAALERPIFYGNYGKKHPKKPLRTLASAAASSPLRLNRQSAPDTVLVSPQAANSRFIFGSVRGGTEMVVSGNLIIMGDVNAGAKITAGGSVIIMGALRGWVCAGTEGDSGAFVKALRFDAGRITLCGATRDLPKAEKSAPPPVLEAPEGRRAGRRLEPVPEPEPIDPPKPRLAYLIENQVFLT